MTVEAGKTYVRRLRALSTSRDGLALRLRLERTLSHASLHPAWLPPSAILCVRRLRGETSSAPHAFANSRGASADWERAIAARLDTLARRAARPARETVAAGAEAVIFEDQSELLACLAVDWCGGVEATRWWWQSLFGVREVAAALLPAWLAAPEHVPAALGRLSAAGKLDAFARKLDARAARDIRQRVTHKFALRALEDALEQTARAAALSQAGRAHDGTQADGSDAQISTRAPWERFVPQARAADLGDEQGALVGMSLMLLGAPSVVRSHAFAEAVTRWRLGTQTDANAEASPAPAVGTAARANDSADETHRGSRQEHGRGPNLEADARRRKIDDASRQQHATPDAAADDASPVEFMESRGVETEDATAFVKTRTTEDYAWGRAEFSTVAQEAERAPETRPGIAATASAEDEERAPRTFVNPLEYAARIRTEFGGVFYLINVALSLNLYGDFTAPLARGIDLPVWDFLALVGAEFCGARVRRDPVWTLLGKLSGREEEEEPGAGFTPPDAWRVAPEWLAAFPGRRAWKWTTEGGRLRVLHPRGFLILDVPSASAGAREQVGVKTAEVETLEAEMAAYAAHLRGPLRRVPFAGVSEPAGTLEGWLARLLPYLRARLGRALGAGRARALGRLVFEHEARVDVTATRLDVTFELARLPLAVRLAGLDRDPGWVPAAGRYVAFHFE
jgi:hypothetical protein